MAITHLLDDYYPMGGYRRMFEALQHPGIPTQAASRVLKIANKLWDDRPLSRAQLSIANLAAYACHVGPVPASSIPSHHTNDRDAAEGDRYL